MGHLTFNKDELVNLEYSLQREILSTNRAGGYLSTTIIMCNTRKYHGLMVLPLKEFDFENHILLSSVDESVIQRGQSFNLGIHRYPGLYEPRGHKYIVDFEYEPTARLTYRVGGVVLLKELLFVHNEEQLMIRYTLIDAHSPTKLRIKPFLAFRNSHSLSRANMNADTHLKPIPNGVKSKLYPGFPYLHMQLNHKTDFIAAPDWYHNIEYLEEQRRGYEFQEDLLVPGFFEIGIKKGESIILSVSTKEEVPNTLSTKFNAELKRRPEKNSFENCLNNSGNQFIVRKDKKTELVAGYPWFGRWGRDTFISLPGITFRQNDIKTCKAVIDTLSAEMKDGLFPNVGHSTSTAFNSADAPLWFFWTIQQYTDRTGDREQSWNDYGKKMKAILKSYSSGNLPYNIKMHENGLVYAGEPGVAVTWMDAVVGGKPVTPREGYPVEINALWYNAICFTLDLAREFKDTKFVKEWEKIPDLIKANFSQHFWIEEQGYLADFVHDNQQNRDVRPNQIFAAALPYSPISDEQKASLLKIVEKELLTPKGLRTLSPQDPKYLGRYEGGQIERDSAYHQGSAWPWLLSFFVEANLKLYNKAYLSTAKRLIENFKEDMTVHGLCSIAEVYDGDPPQRPNGAISQSWSVSSILRTLDLIDQYSKP